MRHLFCPFLLRPFLPLLFLICATSGGLGHAAETFAFSSATYSGAEGTSVVVTVTRTGGSATVANVSFATSDGTAISDGLGGPMPGPLPGMDADYTSINGTLVFLLGETSKTFAVILNDDQDDEDDETLNLTLSAPSSGYVLGSPAVLTITDVPTASWSIGATNVSPVAVNVSFSELVTGLTAGDIVVTNGNVSSVSITSPTSATVQITPTAQGTVTATLQANAVVDADGHGNAQTVGSFTYDSVPPTCNVSTTTPTTTNKNITFTVTFNEDMMGPLDTSHVVVTNGSVTSVSGGLGAPGGDPHTWTIVVSATATGTVTLTIEPGVASDLFGNALVVGDSDSVAYTDVTQPTVTSMGSATPDGTYGRGSPIRLHLYFSEPVTLSGGNMTVSLNSGDSAVFAPFTNSGMAQTVYVVSPTASAVADLNNIGGVTLDAGATLTDLSGNAINPAIPLTTGLGASKDIILVAVNAPAITQISSTTASGTYNAGDIINVTVTFSEPVHFTQHPSSPPGSPITAFFNVMLNSNATVTHVYSGTADSPVFTTLAMVYTVALGQSTSALDATEIAVHDHDVIVNSVGVRLTTTLPATTISPGKTIQIDAVNPTVLVTSVVPDPTSATAIPVVVTFSEPVTGFDASDITTAGTVSAFAGSGSSYTFTLGLVTNATTHVFINGGAAEDAFGNANDPLRAMDAFSRTHTTAPASSSSGSSSGSGSSGCGIGSGLASLTLGLLTLFAMAMRLRRD